MRDDPVNVRPGQSDLVQRGMGGLGQLFDGMAKYFAAFHFQHTRGPAADAAIDIQNVAQGAVGMQISGQNAPVGIGPVARLGPQHQRPGAVAEQHAGGPVGPVDDPAEGFRPDHQHAGGLSRHDQRICGGQRINEARTNRLHIKGIAALHANRLLHHGGGGRESQIGGGGGQDDCVDVIAGQARTVQRPLCGQCRHLRGGLIRGHDVPPFDAGPGLDPLIRRVQRRLEFGIVHDPVGQVMPDALYHGPYGHVIARPPPRQLQRPAGSPHRYLAQGWQLTQPVRPVSLQSRILPIDGPDPKRPQSRLHPPTHDF